VAALGEDGPSYAPAEEGVKSTGPEGRAPAYAKVIRSMALRVLAAGCSADEREAIEPVVRAALSSRPSTEAWNVSVVKMRDKWSVTVDGPPGTLRGWNFVGPAEAIGEAIAGAVGPAASPPASTGHPAPSAAPVPPSPSPLPRAAAPPPRDPPAAGPAPRAPLPRRAATSRALPGGRLEKRDPLDCDKCGQSFVVVYESGPHEPTRDVAVACPHCWAINRLEVADEAGAVGDYRAEKE
jgi:hypothetical protein